MGQGLVAPFPFKVVRAAAAKWLPGFGVGLVKNVDISVDCIAALVANMCAIENNDIVGVARTARRVICRRYTARRYWRCLAQLLSDPHLRQQLFVRPGRFIGIKHFLGRRNMQTNFTATYA